LGTNQDVLNDSWIIHDYEGFSVIWYTCNECGVSEHNQLCATDNESMLKTYDECSVIINLHGLNVQFHNLYHVNIDNTEGWRTETFKIISVDIYTKQLLRKT
jgi:hypothetical protein